MEVLQPSGINNAQLNNYHAQKQIITLQFWIQSSLRQIDYHTTNKTN